MNDKDGDLTTQERFVGLLSGIQPVLHRYVFAQIPDFHGAQDVLQNVCIVLWRKFGEYREGTPFVAWALTVARYEVLHAKRAFARHNSHLEQTIADIATEHYAKTDPQYHAERENALRRCLEYVSPANRILLDKRYVDGKTCETVAREDNVSAIAVRTRLCRLRDALRKCIDDTLHIPEAGSAAEVS